jgi:hypothetical protein
LVLKLGTPSPLFARSAIVETVERSLHCIAVIAYSLWEHGDPPLPRVLRADVIFIGVPMGVSLQRSTPTRTGPRA